MLVAHRCLYFPPSMILCRVANVNMVTRPDLLLIVHMSADRKDDSENTVRCRRQIKRSLNVALFPVACQWNEEFLMVWCDHLWSKFLAISNQTGSFFKSQVICQEARCLAGKCECSKITAATCFVRIRGRNSPAGAASNAGSAGNALSIESSHCLGMVKNDAWRVCLCHWHEAGREVQQSLASRYGKNVAGWNEQRCNQMHLMPAKAVMQKQPWQQM